MIDTNVMSLQDEELISLFSNAEVAPELIGSVEAVRVVRDQATNIGKGFAFVLFKTKVSYSRIFCTFFQNTLLPKQNFLFNRDPRELCESHSLQIYHQPDIPPRLQ